MMDFYEKISKFITLSQSIILLIITIFLMIMTFYIIQYGFGYQPCQLCYTQRWVYYAAFMLSVTGYFFFKNENDSFVLITQIILLLSLIFGFGVAIYQSGLEWGFWEGFTSCSSPQGFGHISLNNLEEEMAKAQIVRCDEAPFRLFLMSPANYNIFASLGYMALNLHIIYQLKLLK